MSVASPELPLRTPASGESESHGLAFIDRTFHVVDLNERLAALVGRPADQLCGRLLAEVLPAWAPILTPIIERVVAMANPELHIALPWDGSGVSSELSQLAASCYPVQTRRGYVTGADLVIHPRDALASASATVMPQDRLQLQQQAELLELIYEPMLVWELRGPIVAWNRGAEALYGFTRTEAIGQISHDLLHTAHPVDVPTFEAELQATGQWQGELQHTTRDGRRLVVESHMTVVVVNGGHFVLESNRDITERTRVEARLHHLQEVTASFAAAKTLDQVHRVILHEVVQALGATIVGLRLVCDDRLELEDLTRGTSVDAGIIQRYSSIPLTMQHPAADVARTGVARFHRDVEDIVRNYPHLAEAARAVPAQANAHLPLTRGGEVFAVLSLHFAETRSWDDGERAFALALADRVAVACERARLFEAERRARERSERLQAVTARLVTALTPADVVSAVLEEGLPSLGAGLGSVVQLDGEELEVIGTVGFPESISRRWKRFSLTTPTPLAEAVRTGKGIWLSAPEDFAQRYGRLPEPTALALAQSSLALPLVASGRVIGALGASYPVPRTFDPDSRRFAETLADQAALALERSRLYADLTEANRLKDEFLATVSHELRTPLTAFLGYAQLLQLRKRDEAYIARTVDKMVQSAKSQAQLIEDLLDVSRIVSGKLRIEPKPIDLIPVVHAALDTVRPAAEAKALQLSVDLDPAASTVIGDPGRLQQVIWNLLANATKFTPSGGSIMVRLVQDAGESVLTVSDTGQGIAPDFLPFVFDRFRQADSTPKRAHSGLGLGLAIVRHLVELHGGRVQATSAGLGQGSTFSIRLPLAASHVASAATSVVHNSDDSFAQCPPELLNLRVLLVDDQLEILDLLDDILSPCGAQVRRCISARAALETLRGWLPDVLVSDIAMPDEDGYWLISQVRALALEEGGSVPAIALTAYVRIEDRLQVLAAGFQQYVPKPVDPIELREVVARLVRGQG